MDEATWIRRAQAGDKAGFAALFEQHRTRAIRTAYLMTQDRHLAEDLTQEAFVRAYLAIRKCDPARPFAPWLMRILINLCRTAMQRRGRQMVVAALPDEGASDRGYADAEDRVQVWGALQRLEPVHREVLMLRYYHDFADAEIAEALDIPVGTVKSRLFHARRHLERHLAPEAGAHPLSKEVLS